MTAWPEIEADLSRSMAQLGRPAAEIVTLLADLKPVVLALERDGTRVDKDTAWCLLGVIADQHARSV